MSEDVTSSGDMTAAVSEAFAAASAESPPASGSETTGNVFGGATPSGSPVPEGTQPAPGATRAQPGPIPYDRFREVNERMQAAEQRAQQIQAQFESHQDAINGWGQIRRDPAAFAAQFGEQLLAHPELSGKFRSLAAKWLRSGGPAKSTESSMPQPDMIDPSTGTKLYSAEQAAQLVEWKTQQLMGQFEQRVAPLEEREQTRAQEAAAQQAWQGALDRASKTLSSWRQMPGFSDHEGDIKALVSKGVDLGLAYAQVVVPKLSQRERDAVTKSLQTKTQATTMSPGYSPSAAPSQQTYRDTHSAARDIARDVFASLS